MAGISDEGARIGTDAPCAEGRCAGTVVGMTETSMPTAAVPTEPPFSRPIQRAIAACLIAAPVLSAVPQYVEHLLAGDRGRESQSAWGLAHQGYYRFEWLAAMYGSILFLLGFLGLWHIPRWSAPKLTAVGPVVLTWGMCGQIFSETSTYAGQVAAAEVFGSRGAERLIAEGYLHDPGIIGGVLVPVIAGMFFGVILLAVA